MSESEKTEVEAQAAPPSETGETPETGELGFISDLPLRLSVELGSTRLLVRDLLQLATGSVIELDRMAGDSADLFVNGRLVARGQITSVEERLAVKLTEVGAGLQKGPGT